MEVWCSDGYARFERRIDGFGRNEHRGLSRSARRPVTRATNPIQITSALEERFRAGFFPDRPAGWLEQIVYQTGDSEFDITGVLEQLDQGRRDFSYWRHDRHVYRLLAQIVSDHRPKRGADIGSAGGVFPAMQLHLGIESVTVFEVRESVADDPRVSVEIHDLSQRPWDGGQFDVVTCLSTIEHVGLGRYGDPLDPEGDLKLFANLRSLIKPGGLLVASFPEGPGCVHFNMHRIYSKYRRDRLFSGYRLIQRIDPRRLRLRAFELLTLRKFRLGWSNQNIYLLTPDEENNKVV